MVNPIFHFPTRKILLYGVQCTPKETIPASTVLLWNAFYARQKVAQVNIDRADSSKLERRLWTITYACNFTRAASFLL